MAGRAFVSLGWWEHSLSPGCIGETTGSFKPTLSGQFPCTVASLLLHPPPVFARLSSIHGEGEKLKNNYVYAMCARSSDIPNFHCSARSQSEGCHGAVSREHGADTGCGGRGAGGARSAPLDALGGGGPGLSSLPSSGSPPRKQTLPKELVPWELIRTRSLCKLPSVKRLMNSAPGEG